MELKNYKNIHFIGIGGIMMSGIAEILVNSDFLVTGSDLSNTKITRHLEDLGIKIYYNHSKENINNSDLIIYSSAINESNPEYNEAIQKNIPTISRAEAVSIIMKDYKYNIAVSGSHGKTTTTNMISNILIEANVLPTVLIGGISSNINSNVLIGKKDYLILEACEYKENFLHFNHNIGVILNVDEDHLDYYEDINHILSAFIKFAKKIPKDGYLILNSDNYNVKKIISHVDCNVITYGINSDANYKAKNITHYENKTRFDVYLNDDFLETIDISTLGNHNVSNALAAFSVCNSLSISHETIKNSLKKFKGTQRRFEILGKYKDAMVIDDYAHHPTEIIETLNTCSLIKKNKVICIFQPHTFSRTMSLMLKFSKAFDKADTVIITDIYAAREVDNNDVHSKDLVKKIKESKEDVIYIKDFNKIKKYLSENINKDDIIITVGAGNIRELGLDLIKS